MSDAETLRRLERLNDAVARASNPNAVMALGEESIGEEFKFNLFTIQLVDVRQDLLRRVYSSNLKVNPLGVTKPMQEWQFARQVVDRGEQFLGRDREDIRRTFFDYELIFSLGCQSILSTPVLFQGKVLGITNVLHPDENFFSEEKTALARVYSQALLPAFLREN